METLEIGGSGLVSSRIALGTWSIGGWLWGGSDDREGLETIHRALERGINLIDTAPIYGFGRSEEILAEALAGGRREGVLLATKAGLQWDASGVRRNSRPERLREELEDSLRRLRTDRIDLYQIHWPDPDTPFDETAATLERFVEEGKVRAIGVSNFDASQINAFCSKGAPLHAVQPPLNLFEREAAMGVLPYAREHGLAVLAYGPLCRGLLTGKIDESSTFSGDDIRLKDPKFEAARFAQYMGAVRELATFAQERYGKSLLALAVRWVLAQGPTIALWGARKPAQIDPVDDILGWSLDEDTLQEIDAIVARHVLDPVGPEFMGPP